MSVEDGISPEADRIYAEASQEGLRLTREILVKHGRFIEPTAVILGTATGATFGSIYKSPNQEHAKEWLNAFFMTMTGGLKKTMGINLSVQWTIKED